MAWLERMKASLGLGEEENQQEQGLLGQFREATTLDRTSRAIGFAACVGIGLLFSFISPMFIFRPTKFAVLYTLGNILSICSTMFLVGPFKQIGNMFDPKRAVSTIIYLVAMILTLLAALKFHSVVLCVLFIVIQFCALVWYVASYIPMAQGFIRRFLPFANFDETG